MARAHVYDVLLVVPQGIRTACNNDAQGWDTLGGAATFTVALTSNPAGVATHYWANSRCTYDHLVSMKNSVLQRGSVKAWVKSIRTDDGELTALFSGMVNVTVGDYTPDTVLNAEGLSRKRSSQI